MKLDLHPDARRYEMGGLHNSGVYCVGLVIEHYLELGKADVQNYILDLVEYCYQKTDDCSFTKLAYHYASENRSGIVVLHVPGKYKLSTKQLRKRGIIVPVNGGLQPDYGVPNPNYSIRIGIHYFNNKEDIDKLFAAIEDCCKK
jgi:selenocysteine lyase/cysteine desulfurase